MTPHPVHTEKVFESALEEGLLANGWVKGDPAAFDRKLAFDAAQLLAFLWATQAKSMTALQEFHGAKLQDALLDGLTKTLESRGVLEVLRHGAKFPATCGRQLRFAYFKPAHGINPQLVTLYEQNRLTVVRQVHYGAANENSVNVVLLLNGIPLATMELKNPLTGQNFRHAIAQYRHDRDPREKIFQFKKRALVHFAVDPDEVHMTTRLSGTKTVFLPFNRGRDNGAGNPDVPGGFKTEYLWEDVLTRDSFMDIVARFVQLQVEEVEIGGQKINKEKMIFPRFHQLDLVRRLEAAARLEGPGFNYLAQHSAGSGKSNSIGWTAHRLATLHDEHNQKVFDVVVVITDRLVLDQQLQDTIYQFEHEHGVVKKVEKSSAELREALESGVPIIVTTLQKFGFVMLDDKPLPDRKYAVIIDEAHSSQTGESAIAMKEVLAGEGLTKAVQAKLEQEDLGHDYEESVVRAMLARGHQPNMSFFAFTATPKYKTLEFFGRPGQNGKPVPFHLYSMRQAIEERFILDVLRNYTSYRTFYRLVKRVIDDPDVDKRKAARALARFVSLHPHNVAQKVQIIVEHFRQCTRHKIGGQAKAMVVTGSRLHAVRYKQALDAYVQEKGYANIKALVAFSGTVLDPDSNAEYTEPQMNGGIPERRLPKFFATGDYQVLIVADKYQTGFDQPLLQTMYVDKRLAGIQAVQTLSRLNRTHAGKEDTFVLDFVNDTEEIRQAFQPYYEGTTIAEEADPQQLYDLQAQLNDARVYQHTEVETFAKAFFGASEAQAPKALAQMNAALDPAVDRFKALDTERQEEFRHLLVGFRNLYGFLSQLLPFQDADLEKLYAFLRFLQKKLPRRDGTPTPEITEDVAMQYYRLQKIAEGRLELEKGKTGEVEGPVEVGTGGENATDVKLSTLIESLNERFATEFTPADQLFFDQVAQEAAENETIVQAAQVNTIDNFKLVFDQALEALMIDRMEQNEEIFARYMNNKDFQAAVTRLLAKKVYGSIREAMAPAGA